MQQYTLHSKADGLELAVRHWQAAQPKARLLIVHGFAEHAGRYAKVAEPLQARGYDVHAIDLRAHGDSPSVANVAQQRANVQHKGELLGDIAALVAHVGQLEPALPLAILGHSMGGLLTCEYLLTQPEHGIAYVILSAPYLLGTTTPPRRLAPLFSGLGQGLPTVPSGQKVNPTLISRIPEEVAAYRDDPRNYTGIIGLGIGAAMLSAQRFVQANAKAFHLPVHIIHGDADKLADVRGSQEFFAAIKSKDKSLELFSGGYHELFNDNEQERAIASVLGWLEQRLT